MADIFHYFTINAPVHKIFDAISTPNGMNKWWTETAQGKPAINERFQLGFGPEYKWTAIVSKYAKDSEFEFTMEQSDEDWQGTMVGFRFFGRNSQTEVHFYHAGWREENDHFRISNYCWAMYLRILKRFAEFGEEVPYHQRLIS
jgi:uncharacterized protein YndB with AHSA1/START domain